MVDIFVSKNQISFITKEAVSNKKRLRISYLWMQLGLIDLKASKIAAEAGITVIMNRCPKIEYSRLSGEISWNGINSEFFTSRRNGLL